MAQSIPTIGRTTSIRLLARLSAADDPSWYEFLTRYGELILSVARRHGLQPADCDDVLQDSMIELTRCMNRFEYDASRGRFRDYLRKVVLRATFRKLRQRYAMARVYTYECGDDCTEPSHQNWELEWRRYHVRRALRAIEAEFSEVNRTAFIMCTTQERSAHDVAATLEISVEQVYQAKSRILKRLTAVIERQVAEEG